MIKTIKNDYSHKKEFKKKAGFDNLQPLYLISPKRLPVSIGKFHILFKTWKLSTLLKTKGRVRPVIENTDSQTDKTRAWMLIG